jgi:trigger factor
MSEEDAKKNKENFVEIAKKRIKVGLILNEFGERNKINVTEQEIQTEVQKQLRTMPGQEKMVMDFYQKNPSAVASLRGTVYEEKIIDLIKTKAKAIKKEISKEEAEKILKQSQTHNHDHSHNHDKKEKKTKDNKTVIKSSKAKKSIKKPEKKSNKAKSSAKKIKKVSKK